MKIPKGDIRDRNLKTRQDKTRQDNGQKKTDKRTNNYIYKILHRKVKIVRVHVFTGYMSDIAGVF